MKVSKRWLKELVEIESMEEVEKLLTLRTIGTKEITQDFIELDMKGYNRADLLSLRGVAYEIAAITSSKVKFTEAKEAEYLWEKETLPEVIVKIENPDLVPLYCVAKIEGLKVAPSNSAWIKKLEESGMRSVDNVTDITNLVMLEYGQPLHAFDASMVANETITVRNAKQGEKLITLDQKIRKLDANDILITDENTILGLAGVMGGKACEIGEATSTILLEAAIFNPASLRKTATRLGITSEASRRFYHGLTKKRLFQALQEAINLYQSLGGKITGLSIIGDFSDTKKLVKLTLEKTCSLIGVDISGERVEEYLKKLYFDLEKDDQSSWQVSSPYWRLDIEIEEDLVEEVARMYGYENIPSKKLAGGIPKPIDQKLFELIKDTKEELVKIGFTEVQTYSFYSTKVQNAISWTKKLADTQIVKVQNPISAETEYMRQNLWPNLVEIIGKNTRFGYEDIAIFEVGKIFWINSGKPGEKYSLAMALTNGTDNPISELNQIFEKYNRDLRLEIKAILEKKAGVNLHLFHPIRFMQLVDKNGQILGAVAEVHPKVLEKFGIDKRVAVLEFKINALAWQGRAE